METESNYEFNKELQERCRAVAREMCQKGKEFSPDEGEAVFDKLCDGFRDHVGDPSLSREFIYGVFEQVFEEQRRKLLFDVLFSLKDSMRRLFKLVRLQAPEPIVTNEIGLLLGRVYSLQPNAVLKFLAKWGDGGYDWWRTFDEMAHDQLNPNGDEDEEPDEIAGQDEEDPEEFDLGGSD